jgi:hypothetical protein
MLLQSHEDAIRVLPTTPNTWTGLFRFAARGGFLVSACFSQGSPALVEIESRAGRPLAIHHPWSSPDASSDGHPPVLVRSSRGIRTIAAPESILHFETEAGEKLLLYQPETF